DVGRAGRVPRDAVGAAALQIEKQRTARRRARRAGRWCRDERRDRAVRALDCVGAESAGSGWRGVAEKSRHAVEDVAPLEKAAEDLRVSGGGSLAPRPERVAGVDPLAAGLDRVRAADDRVGIFQLCPLDQLVDRRAEEERIAEAERR